MVAISLKLHENVIENLKLFSSKKGISQTKIIEESLNKWFKEEKRKEIELGFIKYSENLKKDIDLKKEEDFLINSSITDFHILTQKGNV